jgi:hypothetical protein
MQGAVRRGSFDTLQLMLDIRGPSVRETGAVAEIEALDRIEQCLRQASEIEAQHGTGCLLDLESESVKWCIGKGWIPSAHEAAAVRFKETNSRPSFVL